MMKRSVVGALLLSLVHCGGPAPAPKSSIDAASEPPPTLSPRQPQSSTEPVTEQREALPSETLLDEHHFDQGGATDAQGATHTGKESESVSKPSKPASEVLTQADTDFLLDDSASELKTATKAQCEDTLDDLNDRAALAACMQKERDKVLADVLSFDKAEDGSVRLTIYRRQTSTLSEVYSAGVLLEDASDTGVKISQKGQARGHSPLFKGARSFDVQVPDDYSLVVQDPRWGKLSYRAKYGLVAR